MPELFEVVALNEDGYEHLPEPDLPYYVVAREGTYLHRRTQIGDVLVREPKQLSTLVGRIGFAGGVFTWKGDKVPAKIISQAHDFFLRIFNAKHAEAEVLITKHNTTDEYRLFVPYQRVSHSGVKSIYEPTHVDRNYTVVGTLHSHCDFTAFHSGTDSGDASDMDGVHFTIGKVNLAIPEIVAMVTMNGKEFHYKEPSEIAETVFGSHTAPEWWDQYVFGMGEAPAQKPAGLISLTQEHWDEFLGRALVKPKTTWVPTTAYTPPTNKWQEWKPQQSTYDWRREVYGAGPQPRLPAMEGDFEDLDNPLITRVLDAAEKAGVFSDYDWTDIKASDVDEPDFWKGFFINRLNNLLDVLELFDIKYDIKPKKGKQ